MEPLSLANHSQMVQYYLHYNLQIPSLFILKSREEEFTNSSLGGLATSHSLLINEILSLETLTFLLFTFVNVLHLSSCIFFFFFLKLFEFIWNGNPLLAWRIPGAGEPGGLLSMGSHRVGHDWSDLAVAVAVLTVLVRILETYQTD